MATTPVYEDNEGGRPFCQRAVRVGSKGETLGLAKHPGS